MLRLVGKKYYNFTLKIVLRCGLRINLGWVGKLALAPPILITLEPLEGVIE